MPIWKADHFAFQVADLDAAIDFYSNKLGMQLLFRETDPEHGEAFAFLELDGGNLELLSVLTKDGLPQDTETRAIAPPYCPHLALATDDLEATLRLLREKSIAIVKGPLEIPGSVRWLYVTDPDGNILEFVQWLDKESS